MSDYEFPLQGKLVNTNQEHLIENMNKMFLDNVNENENIVISDELSNINELIIKSAMVICKDITN